MIRKTALVALAVLCVAGLVAAADKTASGTVKTVAADSITVTDSAAKDWTFVVDKETAVHAAGATHKMDKLKADGKPTLITEFVAAKKNVIVKYVEKDGKMMAKEVDVK